MSVPYKKGMPLYKYFNTSSKDPDRLLSPHGANLTWDLPKNGKPGRWKVMSAKPMLCSTGFHAAWNPRAYTVLHNIHSSSGRQRLFRVEIGGRIDKDDLKLCAQRIRLMHEVLPGTPEWDWVDYTQTSGWKGVFKLTVPDVQALYAKLKASQDEVKTLKDQIAQIKKLLA